MRKLFYLLLTFCFLYISQTHASDNMIRIAVEPNNAFLERLLPHILKEGEIQAELLKYPTSRALQELNAGNVDANGLRLRVVEKHFPNIIRMPVPIMDIDFIAITNRPDISIHHWDDLKKYRVAYPSGWKIFEVNVPKETHVTTVNSQEQLFKILDLNRVEVILISKPIAHLLLKSHPVQNVRLLTPPLHQTPSYMFFHKSKSVVMERMSTALTRIKQNGIYHRIYSDMYPQYLSEN